MREHEPVLTVVGLGKLGVCIAGVFSAAGYVVNGTDRSPDVLGAILANKANPEPGLNDLIRDHPFNVGDDTAALARESDVALIVVPTPSGDDGRFDPSMVCEAVTEVARGFKERARATYPVVVVVSTVMPSTMDTVVRSAVEAEGLTVGVDAGLVYSPSLIALGSVIQNLRHPDVCLMGTSDDAASRTASHLYRRMVAAGTPFHHLSLIDCEIAKLSINAYLSVKVGFANTVARVCEGQTGANVGQVLAAVGTDKRIGHLFLKAGGVAGGQCLPRDSVAFGTIGGGAVSQMITHADGETLDWVASHVEKAVADADGRFTYDVSVLGLSYKPSLPHVGDSFGLRILNRLRPLYEVACHDPYSAVSIQRVTQEHRLVQAQDAAVIVVACAHELYETIEPQRGQTVIDVWNHCADGPNVIRPGVGLSSQT